MKATPLLRWLERALLAAGLLLGGWCAVVLFEAHRAATLSPPEPTSSIQTPVRGSWVAKLDAPSVHLSATVLEGSDDATLGRAAGHIEETPFPWQSGNIGIAGHRDTTFRAVRHLHLGDPIELTTAGSVYRYRVTKTFIVDPEDVYVLDPGAGPMLTLVTCYPFEFIGHAPHRYIIQAELVDQVSRTAKPGVAGG